MLRFFRQIRQRLLADHKFSKYLLYAVGEILLVVIGILIALQVDNWNEQRTLRKKERVYLSEINEDLLSDLTNLERFIASSYKKDSIIDQTLSAFLEFKTDQQVSMAIMGNMARLAEFFVFTQNRVAFDNMLSAESIGLIHDNDLRRELATYYKYQNLLTGVQDRQKDLTRIFVDYVSTRLMTQENIQMFYQKPNDFPSAAQTGIRTDQKIFGDLFSMKQSLRYEIEYLEGYQERCRSLLASIEAYLKPKA